MRSRATDNEEKVECLWQRCAEELVDEKSWEYTEDKDWLKYCNRNVENRWLLDELKQ